MKSAKPAGNARLRRPARPWVPLGLCLGALALPQLRDAQALDSRPRFTVEDLMVLKRVSDP
jgi:hypothetical protein